MTRKNFELPWDMRGAHDESLRRVARPQPPRERIRGPINPLVDLDENVGLIGLGRLERELGEMLGVAVDVPASALKVRLRDDVLSQAVPL